ncbi:hypothetical protein LEMLEM_LOCUS17237 [Lemmus lemmus]
MSIHVLSRCELPEDFPPCVCLAAVSGQFRGSCHLEAFLHFLGQVSRPRDVETSALILQGNCQSWSTFTSSSNAFQLLSLRQHKLQLSRI